MANLLQQRTLNEIVKQYSSLYGLPSHKAFLYLIIEKYLANLELNSVDIEESIVDGSNDCGIDAIVIDEETTERPHIYFFQSKFYEAENAFERSFEGNALEKMQSAVADFFLKGKINPSYQNERLVDKLHSVKNLFSKNPKLTMVFCSNSAEPTEISKSRLEDFIKESDKAREYLSAEYLSLEKIATELIAPQQESKIDVKLQTSGKYLIEDTGNIRLFVGSADAKDLVQLVEAHGDNLFERNIRGYLGSKNLNKNIVKTASSEQSPYFVYMNNGITITCEKFSFVPVSSSPCLDINNIQIVNGQQTVRSLYQANKAGNLKEDVKVLVRIVETSNSELLMQIIEATNSQTKVTSRDLHSNDEIQKLIEKHLISMGYFYESRKNKYRGKEVAKRIDAEEAAQVYYATFFEQPALAKDKKKTLFSDKYDEIFNSNTKPEDLLYSFLLLRKVQKLNNLTDKDKYTFLSDATLHTVALINKKNGRLNLEDTLNKEYKEIIDTLKKVVDEKVQEEGDKYEHRKTFKDPETYGRAVELLNN
jgi:hypothetical protein